jgi:hypothetical protein
MMLRRLHDIVWSKYMTNKITVKSAYYAMYLYTMRCMEFLDLEKTPDDFEDGELSLVVVATELAVDQKGRAVSIDAWRTIYSELLKSSSLQQDISQITEEPGDVLVTIQDAYTVLIEFLRGPYFKSLAKDIRGKLVTIMLDNESGIDKQFNSWQGWLEAVNQAVSCERQNNWPAYTTGVKS